MGCTAITIKPEEEEKAGKQEESSCLGREENWQEITINYIPAVLIVPGACPANLSSLIRIFAPLQNPVTCGVKSQLYQIC